MTDTSFIDYQDVMRRPLHEWRPAVAESLTAAEVALQKALLEMDAVGLALAKPHPADASAMVPNSFAASSRMLTLALAAVYDAQAYMAREGAMSVTRDHAHTQHLTRLYYEL